MKNTNTNCCKKTTIGGQALIEGIFMMGPEKSAVVCNTPDGFVEKVEKIKLLTRKYPILGLPFIRGIVSFGTSMKRGVSALFFSAEQIPDEEQDKLDEWIEKRFGKEKAEKLIMNIAVVLGVALPVFMYLFLPAFLAGLLKPVVPVIWVRNLIEAVFKIAIFLSFMTFVSKQKDMKRLFSYHGAEHKSIHCYESGEELTVENVKKHTRLHPRCGTSFLFVVIIISILVTAPIQVDNVWLRLLVHLVMLLPIVSISYEFNRLVGRYDNWLTKILRAPGLAIQKYITTREPDEDMIATAIRAITLVIPEDQELDRW